MLPEAINLLSAASLMFLYGGPAWSTVTVHPRAYLDLVIYRIAAKTVHNKI